MRAFPAFLSAEDLLEKAWDEHTDPFTSTVTVTMSRLRRKLGDPPVIATTPGVGYRIVGQHFLLLSVFQVVHAGGVAGQDACGGFLVGHQPGDGAGVGGDAGDARPVRAEDHPPGQPGPALAGVVVTEARRREAGELDPDP